MTDPTEYHLSAADYFELQEYRRALEEGRLMIIPVVWNGNYYFTCPFCHRRLNVKQQRLKKVQHVDPKYFNSGREGVK